MSTKNIYEKHLIISVGDADYAIPVSDVEAVLSLRRSDVSMVPFDVNHKLCGIFNYKGSVVALLRVEGLFSCFDENKGESLTVVLLKNGETHFAISVDSVRAVEAISENDMLIVTSARMLYSGETDENN